MSLTLALPLSAVCTRAYQLKERRERSMRTREEDAEFVFSGLQYGGLQGVSVT